MDNKYLSVNWPSAIKKNSSSKNESISNSSKEKKTKKSCFKFNVFKKSKKPYEDNLKNQNKSYISNSNGKGFFILDHSENSNIYFLYNPDLPRKLSVITEERTSGISSRSNSADRTQTVI